MNNAKFLACCKLDKNVGIYGFLDFFLGVTATLCGIRKSSDSGLPRNLHFRFPRPSKTYR